MNGTPFSRYKFDSLNCTFWNSNISFAAPNETEQCDSWNYDTSVFTSTVVGDFDLVCDNKYKRRLSQAIFMLGVVIATPVWGQVSDRYGIICEGMSTSVSNRCVITSGCQRQDYH